LESTCKICKGRGFVHKIIDGYDYEVECECQIPLKIERWLKLSGVDYAEYARKNLDTFKTDTAESKAMKALAEKFIHDKVSGIAYFGENGTGKTHICISICQELTRKYQRPHLYFSYSQEVQKLKSLIFSAQEYQNSILPWKSAPVLYIDDLFKFALDRNGNVQMQDLQIMFDIINTRYINKSITIFSSEYTLNDINKIDSALAGRIYEMCNPYLMKCTEKSRRFK